nr:TraR/DksA C4-type zinc finger protein [Aquabacterium terrae]
MAHGHYGVCIDCGRDIPVARLDVQPSSARCAPCQEIAERKGSHAPNRYDPGA